MLKKKISFIIIIIFLISLVVLKQGINIHANDYIVYDLNNPPNVVGTLLETQNTNTITEFWHFSGGYWKYTPTGEESMVITHSDMNTILASQTINKDIILVENLPSSVVNYLSSGGDLNNLKLKIKETDGKNYVDIDSRPNFQYKIDMTNNKIILKFQPKFNVKLHENFWQDSLFEGIIPVLPVVEEGYGNAMFSVFRRSGGGNMELEYGLDDSRKLQNPDEIRIVGNDGYLTDSKTYVNSVGVEFNGADYKIGNGTFTSGGAVGIKFIFNFEIKYYTAFTGDFTISAEGNDVTDSSYSVDIGENNYGQNHDITLNYVGSTDGIDYIKWYDDYGFEYITNDSSFSVTSTAKGGESPGRQNNYYMHVYYTDGGKYPQAGDPSISHNVTVIENKDNSSGGNGNGEIVFTANSSFNIAGNREGWVKQNISVNVKVEGETTIEVNGSVSWGYEYRTWDSHDRCIEYDPETGSCIDWEGGWDYHNGTSSRDYTETWEVKSIKVWGTGENANGSVISLPTKIISGTSGTYTISSELKNIKLQAEVYDWKPKSRSWDSSDNAPRDGVWDSGSPPIGDTTKPNEKYSSESGLYYLDKENPTIISLNPSSKDWTNSTITVPVNMKDNLSGFWSTNTYFEIIDNSYLNQPTIKQNFTKGSINETKNAVINKDGIYTIKICAEDIAKNNMTTNSYGLYKFDSTLPYAAKFSADNREYIDEDLEIVVTIGDNLSGVTETRYVLNNHPVSNSGMHGVPATTSQGQKDYDTFTVNITEPGSWWIHVYQKDRAGNIRYSVSPEYKIVRLGDKWNDGGKIYSNENNECLWVNPTNKVVRATRFDVLLKAFGLTQNELSNTAVYIKTPKWVNDAIDKKNNGEYVVSTGTVTQEMIYYDGYEEGSQSYANATTTLQWWKSFISPYGTGVSLDREGNRVKEKYEFEVQLYFNDYFPNKTHKSKVNFDIVPETKIKTEIIKNEF